MFSMELRGDLGAILRLEQLPSFVHDRLLGAMQDIQQRLYAAVIAAEPDKSGALRGMTVGEVYDNANSIAASVRIKTDDANAARKAAALEYGSSGKALEVRAHKMKLDHLWSRARSGPPVDVPDYMRTPDIQADKFLRGPIDAMRADFIASLQDAVDQAVRDSEAS